MENSFLSFKNEADLIEWLRSNITLTLDKVSNSDYYSNWDTVEARVTYKDEILTSDAECIFLNTRRGYS